jgi:hypothetical protein
MPNSIICSLLHVNHSVPQQFHYYISVRLGRSSAQLTTQGPQASETPVADDEQCDQWRELPNRATEQNLEFGLKLAPFNRQNQIG